MWLKKNKNDLKILVVMKKAKAKSVLAIEECNINNNVIYYGYQIRTFEEGTKRNEPWTLTGPCLI